MSSFISLLSKLLSFLLSLVLFLFKIIKYIFAKFWKFVLLIVGFFLSLLGIKKAAKKETQT